ncbi:protein phosphatase 2C domain-containing protein [Saccharopolyspora griseoalba]|uniref:Protein phosphatase 2C domain-containing protein n=1 Tax=Saccharopolyspora griseoalba TaxID=1431848 RepID=A0ABW2LMK6_9PSEU
MDVAAATIAAPGRRNEDCFAAGPDWAFVLDGATAPPGVDSGCAHDVVWLVRQLGGALAGLLTSSEAPLAEVLAEAVERTRAAHPGCDLSNPSSPSSTVTMLRVRERAEYLVLADSPLVLDTGAEVRAVVDDRLDHLPSYTQEAVRDLRNHPEGFWVASTDPEAAHQAVRGAVPSLHRAALLTDGASRYVEHFHRTDWPGLLDLLSTRGPDELLVRVRQAETAEPPPPRAKPHDDATALVVRAARP